MNIIELTIVEHDLYEFFQMITPKEKKEVIDYVLEGHSKTLEHYIIGVYVIKRKQNFYSFNTWYKKLLDYIVTNSLEWK